jgi:anti-sigma B factor antagonist
MSAMTWEQTPDQLLHITARRSGQAELLILSGELDLSNCEQLYEHVRLAIDAGVRQLTCDMSDLAFVDSTGVSLFLSTHKRMQSLGGSFALRSLTPNVSRVLNIAGVLSTLVDSDAEQASS